VASATDGSALAVVGGSTVAGMLASVVGGPGGTVPDAHEATTDTATMSEIARMPGCRRINVTLRHGDPLSHR
jgi:hypothetical protein